MWLFLLFSFLAAEAKNTIVYDTYYGTVLTKEQIAERIKTNTTFWCTVQVKVPCDPNEGRRVDGSCNNLALPSRGAARTPFLKVLPQDFGKGYGPRLDQSGQPLPLARPLRASLLSMGTRPDLTFTQLATHFFVFVVSDITTVQDTINYVLWKTYCCQPKGKTDPECVPQKVPADDPVHRFSEVRCLNLTKPITYQSLGCVNDGSPPDKITSATPALDLSTVYGKSDEVIIQKGRLLKGGLLKYEVVDGRVFPPKVTTGNGICYLNVPPRETRCHDTPEVGANSLLGINLCSIWFWRNHNRIARSLARLNPCWGDEKLFNTAREINIATFVQIFLYELLAVLLGYDNLVYDSVLSPNPGFRDVYNNRSYPQISSEFPYVLRWVHLMQDGRLKMYDEAGYYVKQIPIVNATLRTGYLPLDNNMDYITQGSFRQPCGKLDYTMDPEIANNILGGLQRSSDVGTSDLVKGRYYGFPPYVEYRKLCGGKTIKSFDDLADVISVENLELLKEAYANVRDIELMAGLWLEKLIDGAYVPPTFYCLVVEQMVRSIASDRHWYERPNRPNAFTLRQLKEIRKASISRLLCDVGDKVTRIQRSGFLRAAPNNKIDSCKKLPTIDLSAWKDNSCDSC